MLREFIKCTSTMERVEMLQNTIISDWTDEELDTIIDIMGIRVESEYQLKEDKIAAIAKGLSLSKASEKNTDFDFEKLDIISMKNNDTLDMIERIYKQF